MIYDARLQNDIKVANLIHNGNWCWPGDWLSRFPALNQIHYPHLNEEIKDPTIWVTKTGQIPEYSSKNVWKDMSSDYPRVIWRSLIWFAQCIPKHSFVLWLAVQNRLMT
ncbi:reverse transcriptase zinc-binding domain-containing protein [Artemisia annua]|uniref:Reverse transcriptase zinc-binding domain-containing protein n=1 Tax=Artemisia annua TaxID=35608 RepID=A0A2U1NG91_ARTAN|nr:reverse transcriptase zinc-binding domain-containing protein [Artemisia annua]